MILPQGDRGWTQSGVLYSIPRPTTSSHCPSLFPLSLNSKSPCASMQGLSFLSLCKAWTVVGQTQDRQHKMYPSGQGQYNQPTCPAGLCSRFWGVRRVLSLSGPEFLWAHRPWALLIAENLSLQPSDQRKVAQSREKPAPSSHLHVPPSCDLGQVTSPFQTPTSPSLK